MPHSKIVAITVIVLIILTHSAPAGDFDGSKSLSGITHKLVEITPYKIMDDVDPDTIGFPQKYVVDFRGKILRPSADSLVRKTIRFKHMIDIENKIVMQGVYEGVEGVDDGLAWSLTINKMNGKAVLTASGDGRAYVVFGQCTPID